jgi:DNA-binding transcriptional regulator LsrR (DeoR family)
MQLSPEMTAQDIANDRRRILNLQCVQEHFEAALECSVVFTGIGSLSIPRLRKLFLDIGLTEAELRPPAVGDLGYKMIYHDKEVFHRDDPLSNRLITIPMDTLRQIARNPDRLVVVVAWGKDKAAPALDAYRANVYNSLIIDEEMAREMIRLIETGYLSPS